jgi:uncharacterized protein YjbI with pentapeptide repeats
LFGSDLTEAILDGANLKGAVYDDETRFPAGFLPDQQGAENRG